MDFLRLPVNLRRGARQGRTVIALVEGLERRGLLATLTPVATAPNLIAGVLPANPVVVGYFLDSDTSATKDDFTASINWGDGHSSDGTVDDVPGTPGLFSVSGVNLYMAPGANPVTITTSVQDKEGNAATIQSKASVSSPLTATGTTFSTTIGVPLPAGTVVANVSDINPAVVGDPDPASRLSAVIDWGDGQTGTGNVRLVTKNASVAAFMVQGTHVYLTSSPPASYKVVVTILDPSGQTTTANSTATVASPIAASGTTFPATPGVPLANQAVAFFTDTNPGAGSSTALIDWGDGQTSTGAIGGPDANGVYTVAGNHTYATNGSATSYPVKVTIVDPRGQTAVANSTAVVVTPIAAFGTTFPVVPGVPLTNQAVATFTDTNSGAGSSTALVDWGDGQVSTGTITGPVGGVYTVKGNHAYSAPGAASSYQVKVTIVDPTGQRAVANSTAVVVPFINATGTAFTVTPGVPLQPPPVVANFTDTNPAVLNSPDPAKALNALIDWGDGQTSAGTVSAVPPGSKAGTFQVTGSHVYSTTGTATSYAVKVTIIDPSGQTAVASSTALVATLIAATGTTFPATPGHPLTNQAVATFTDSNPAAGSSTAVINWGDGQTGIGTITGPVNGVYTVTGNHTFAPSSPAGSYAVTVTIVDPSGQTAVAHSTALVAAFINATGTTFPVTPGVPLVGQTVSNFTDTNSAANAGNIHAVINWGDGQTTTGMVSGPDANGIFTVTGSHVYSTTGTATSYPVTVTITDPSGQTAVANSTALVTTLIVATGTTFPAMADVTLVDQTVATFTDANPAAASSTALINWGDGQTSVGSISRSVNGVYTVAGSHTYVATNPARFYAVTVAIVDPSGQTAIANSTAIIVAPTSTATSTTFLTGGLAAVTTNGPRAAHGYTNTNKPIFSGTAPAFSIVQIYSRHFHVNTRIPIGEAVADANGHWTFTSGPLAAGIYVFAATVTIPGGYPSDLIPLKNADGTQLGYIGLTPRIARAILHHARAIPNLAGTHVPHPRMPRLSWPGHRRT